MIIFWFSWKIRNTLLHGGSYDENKIIWEINDTIIKFTKIRLHMDISEREWANIVDVLQSYRSSYSFKEVKWMPPETGWVKGNTDGASKGNPRLSSTSFVLQIMLVN